MDDIQDHCHQYVQARIEKFNELLNTLSPVLLESAQIMQQCCLNDGKFMICSDTYSSPEVGYLLSQLLHRDSNLPAIHAISLMNYPISPSTISTQDIWSRQIHSIGTEKDILIIFSDNDNITHLSQTIRTAHSIQMKVLAIVSPPGIAIIEELGENDYLIPIDCEDLDMVKEMKLITINFLCYLLDRLLFG